MGSDEAQREANRRHASGQAGDGLDRQSFIAGALWQADRPVTVTAEQRKALARTYLAERSGAENVAFYESEGSRLWVDALAAADRGLSALGIAVGGAGRG